MPKAPKIIPISDLRQNASDIIKRVASSREPVFITQRGRAAAVMVSMKEYEHAQHENEILRLLARGEKEIEAGIGYDLDEVLKEADKILDGVKLENSLYAFCPPPISGSIGVYSKRQSFSNSRFSEQGRKELIALGKIPRIRQGSP